MAAAGYTTREVSKLVGIPAHRVRAYARAGIVGPPGVVPRRRDGAAAPHWRFDFRDLLVLRMAGRLLVSGFAPRRVQRALVALRRHLAAHRPLSGAQVVHEAGRLVAADGAIAWEPESGQCLLRFAAKRSALAAPVPLPPATSSVAAAPPPIAAMSDLAGQGRADAFFDRAIALEEGGPEQAYGLYLKALACDPEHVEAMINIGRLCSAHGDGRRAAAYFRQAVRCDPVHPVAHFNLAVTLQDLGDNPAAVAAYEAALLHDPHFADAHYNLATLLQEVGDTEEAERHLQAYRRLCNSRA